MMEKAGVLKWNLSWAELKWNAPHFQVQAQKSGFFDNKTIRLLNAQQRSSIGAVKSACARRLLAGKTSGQMCQKLKKIVCEAERWQHCQRAHNVCRSCCKDKWQERGPIEWLQQAERLQKATEFSPLASGHPCMLSCRCNPGALAYWPGK